jgi:choline dehydrogenase
LRSASPFDRPLVNPNYLAHPNDLKILIRGVRLSLRIARTKALEPALYFKENDDKNDVFWLGDADTDQIEDEEIIESIRANAETLYHPIGTCKMGQNEKDSVVNPELKVHGVAGLRVADASIFPEQISGHPVC